MCLLLCFVRCELAGQPFFLQGHKYHLLFYLTYIVAPVKIYPPRGLYLYLEMNQKVCLLEKETHLWLVVFVPSH